MDIRELLKMANMECERCGSIITDWVVRAEDPWCGGVLRYFCSKDCFIEWLLDECDWGEGKPEDVLEPDDILQFIDSEGDEM